MSGLPSGKGIGQDAGADAEELEIETDHENEVAVLQCYRCGKWRKLPQDVDEDELPDEWVCENNKWDPEYASCDVPQVMAEAAGSSPLFCATQLSYRHNQEGSE